MEAGLLHKKRIEFVLGILGALLLMYSTFLAIKYSGQPLLDEYAFRQTQTALTSFWFMKTGFKLAYETPVMGFPWSIPFEFPLYQYIVAKIAYIFDADLQQTGRLVSYFFLLACLIPASAIFKKLYFSDWLLPFSIFVVLFVSSPLYLYWGRTFMIESTALFFSLCFLNYAVSLIFGDLEWKNIVLGGLFLLVSLLQKVTTVLPLMLVVGVLSVRHVFLANRFRINFNVIFKFTITFIIPLAIASMWNEFTDVIKSKNSIAAHLTSDRMGKWLYGNLDMRTSKTFWYNTIWLRVISANIAGYLGCLILILGLVFLSKRERILISLSLMIFMLHFLIFTNLHIIHTYYQTANTIFLIAALTFAITGFILRFPSTSYLMLFILLVLVYFNIYHFIDGYYRYEKRKFDKTQQTLAVSDFIRENTSPEDVVLVYGYDWSSEISFFSQRKTLTFPGWHGLAQNEPQPIEDPTYFLGKMPSAIIICQTLLTPARVKELTIRMSQLYKPKIVKTIRDCDVYLI